MWCLEICKAVIGEHKSLLGDQLSLSGELKSARVEQNSVGGC